MDCQRFLLFLSFLGVILDYITTRMGLLLGFSETNPDYNPVLAFMFYLATMTMMSLTLPQRVRNVCLQILSIISFLAPANNILVILGLFSGISL